MNQRSHTLQKLYTLEEVSMTYWEVEKFRHARNENTGNSIWLEPLSGILHNIESSLIRKQGTALLESLREDFSLLEEKISELNRSKHIPSGLDSRLERARVSIGQMIALIEKEIS